jgi:hypothetical protein
MYVGGSCARLAAVIGWLLCADGCCARMAAVRGWLPFGCYACLSAVQGWLAGCSEWLAAERGYLLS